MKWSPEQDRALAAVAEWERSDRQLFYLAGYAGTGKTTLAKHFAESSERRVHYAAFTGKAAHVMQQKGCDGARTVHSLIYVARDKSRRRLAQMELELAELLLKKPESDLIIGLKRAIQVEREKLAQPAFALNENQIVHSDDLVIIDECSMVSGRMGQDLLSLGAKVLVLGDPAQLPPVGDVGFFTAREPDAMLTEIHRQARDNPILWLATEVREKRRLKPDTYGSSQVLPAGFHLGDLPLEVSQILVGRNATRGKVNARMRERLDFNGNGPHAGEKLICLRNDPEFGLLNGSQWEVSDSGVIDDELISLRIRPWGEDDAPFDVIAWRAAFEGQVLDLHWSARRDAQEFDYGYAITCHKAQGSQWPSVLIWDESICFRGDQDKWLYTAITRASERVFIYQT